MFTVIAALALVVFSAIAVSAQTAKIQIIHNAADPAAETVDVYANGEILINDFKFRTAFGYVEVPAGVPITVAIAPDTSTSAASKVFDKTFTLEAGQVYVAVANGLLKLDGFATNADLNARPLTFDVYPVAGRTEAKESGTVDLFAWHGSTDAPAVDVVAGGSRLIQGISYGSASSYLTVPPGVYDLGIAPTGGAPIATFRADVSGLGGAAIVIVASGFLDPAANGGGPAFGLFAVAPTGGDFIVLPSVPTPPTALVQIIHNAADPGASVVDVWAGTSRLVNDLAFRTATEFLLVPAGVEIPIGIAPGTSDTSAQTLATFNVNLAPGRYIVTASGLLDTTEFAPNGDASAASRSFSLYSAGDIRSVASEVGNVDILVFHGATDAPKVDILAGGAPLISGLSYGQYAEYKSVPTGSYVIGVAPAGGAAIASFTADVSTLGGKAISVFASGFLDPDVNKGGVAFGLFAALPSGGALIQLPPVTTSVDETSSSISELNVSPNPITGDARFSYYIYRDATVTARLIDVTGGSVALINLGFATAGRHQASLGVLNVPSGPYYLVIDSGFGTVSTMINIVR
ncbi:MAG TPA: DUF4397 domain-containing protein [Candidatus Didemnitutus sp.]|nr:DUF4397 domain-containing protein [Candidatus Didemnitutus sp.]